MIYNNISQVVTNDLCTGCGICVALCKKKAIKLIINENKGIYIPLINEEICHNCSTCFNVCPGHKVNFKQLNTEIFGKQPENILIGNYLNCYTGHSTDNHIRYNSSSGGFITQILIFALEEGMIDGALVTRMKKNNPLEPEPFIASTKKEIIEASKSKYCPVPLNLILDEIVNSCKNSRYAVVGLPCHIHGIRMAELYNKELKSKISLHLGLFCGHSPTFSATKLLLRTNNIHNHNSNVNKISYRGEGWPGGVKLTLKNGNSKFIPHSHRYAWGAVFCSAFFSPYRCLLCPDGTCELADIAVGDAWLPELSNDNYGTSMIIVRTKRGLEYLQNAHNSNLISLKEVNEKKVIESQRVMLNFKKNNLYARKKIFESFNKQIPNICYFKPPNFKKEKILFSIPFSLCNLISQNLIFQLFINKIPVDSFLRTSSIITELAKK